MDNLLKSQIEATLPDGVGWIWKIIRSGEYRVRNENNIFYGVGSDKTEEVFPIVITNSVNDEPLVSFKGVPFAYADIKKAVDLAYEKAQPLYSKVSAVKNDKL